MRKTVSVVTAALAVCASARAQTNPAALSEPASGPEALEPITVTGKAEDLLGTAPSATKGQANNEELSARPVLRRGELLETVPGVIITQHAGGGKANQYFLRGFNLDHGTDFSVSMDGMPVNMRTHAHGQGYADLNPLIPEFIERLDYFKGPFFAELGDLSSAGGAHYRFYHALPRGIASLTLGENNYYRALLGDSWSVGDGYLTLGGEYSHEDGPWEIGDDFRRFNGFLRWHEGDDDNFFNLTVMSYRGSWHSTDQIPRRGVESGLIDRFSSPETTDTGESQRHSLSLNWKKTDGDVITTADLWLAYYDLELYSNFTYFLADPRRGDQFEQNEGRWFAGGSLSREWRYELAGLPSSTIVGVQTRHDFIDDIGLYLTKNRERFQTVRKDNVYEGSVGVFATHETRFTDWFRAGAGLRADWFYFDVDGDRRENGGTESDGILSPKARLVFGPWAETEFYVNGGLGFHSNDARGTVIGVDPVTGESVDRVDPLVRTKGAEVGVRSNVVPGLTLTSGLWILDSDSELVYVGDAGTTEAGPASRRYGVETTAYWRPAEWVALDAEYSWSHARFRGVPSGEDHVPGAVEHMAAAGFTLGKTTGPYTSLRMRWFAPRPLEESGKIKSKQSLTFNARVGYRWRNLDVALDCLNLFDRDNNDIEYWYESRLRGEPPGGFGDVHLHPAEPRQFRATVTYRW